MTAMVAVEPGSPLDKVTRTLARKFVSGTAGQALHDTLGGRTPHVPEPDLDREQVSVAVAEAYAFGLWLVTDGVRELTDALPVLVPETLDRIGSMSRWRLLRFGVRGPKATDAASEFRAIVPARTLEYSECESADEIAALLVGQMFAAGGVTAPSEQAVDTCHSLTVLSIGTTRQALTELYVSGMLDPTRNPPPFPTPDRLEPPAEGR